MAPLQRAALGLALASTAFACTAFGQAPEDPERFRAGSLTAAIAGQELGEARRLLTRMAGLPVPARSDFAKWMWQLPSLAEQARRRALLVRVEAEEQAAAARRMLDTAASETVAGTRSESTPETAVAYASWDRAWRAEREAQQRYTACLEMAQVVRRGIGYVVASQPPSKSKALGRELLLRLKKLRGPQRTLKLIEGLRVAVWLDVPAVRSKLDTWADAPGNALRPLVHRARLDRPGLAWEASAILGLSARRQSIRRHAIRQLQAIGGVRATVTLAETLSAQRGRTQATAIAALRAISGEDHKTNRQLWLNWVARQGHRLAKAQRLSPPTAWMRLPRQGYQPQPLPMPEEGEGFYGIDDPSLTPLFLLDLSGSMGELLPGEDPLGEEGRPMDPKGRRLLDEMGRQLLRTVTRLPTDAHCGVAVFSGEARAWQDGMVQASAAHRDQLRAWTRDTFAGGGTNLADGLRLAIAIAVRGHGVANSTGRHRTLADTLYVLTDGQPSAGVPQDTPGLLQLYRERSAGLDLCIHTVALGDGAGTQLLRAIAIESGGRFVHRR